MDHFTQRGIQDAIAFRSNVGKLRHVISAVSVPLDEFKPDEQLLGLTILMHVYMQEFGVNEESLRNVALGILADADDPWTINIPALRDYLRAEILGKTL